MEFHWLVLLLLSPLPVMLAIAIYAWQRRGQVGARLLLALMLTGSVMTVAYVGDLFGSDLVAKLFWLQIWYLATSLVGPLLFLLALWHVQRQQWLTAQRIALVFAPAALMLVLFLTNPWHHQFYVSFGLDASSAPPLRTSVRGLLYWANTFVVFVYLLSTIIVLAGAWRRSAPPYNTQAAILLTATLAPLVGGGLHALGIDALGYVNLASISLLVTGVTYAWGIARHQLFDLVPVVHQTILQRMLTGVVVVDGRGWIVEINPSACAMFATQRRQAIGRPLTEVFAPWSKLESDDRHLAADKDRAVTVDNAGVVRELLVTAEPLPDTQATPTAARTVILLQDVTARRAAERATREQQRQLAILEERERMARDLHDGVGQVLGYVSVQTQIAREYLRSSQTQMADATLAHLAAVTQDAHADLRNFILGSQLGAQPGAPALLHCGTALTQFVQRFEEQYGQQVNLILAGAETPAWMTPEAQTQLLYVIQEALTNVRKHAHAARTTVRCQTSADAVEVTVEDDGAGFDPHAVAGEHFGLQIMRARMDEVGGSLEVSSAVGRGTKVVACLQRPLDALTAVDGLAGLRVLLADDQPLFRDGLHNLLAARGIQVVGVAANGAEAVQLAHDLQPDVVIMDINMPVLDGLAATEQIKLAFPRIKVLMLTVAESDATLLDALRRGADGYLLKSLDAQTLFTMLAQLQRGETVLAPTLATHLVQQFAHGHAHDDPALSARQQEILHLMAQGYTYRQIGLQVHLSESAVKYNAGQILDRLHARTRAEAVRMAEKRGLV